MSSQTWGELPMKPQVFGSSSMSSGSVGERMTKRRTSETLAGMQGGRITVPAEYLPYLKRVQTKDIMKFLDTQQPPPPPKTCFKRCTLLAEWILLQPYFDLFMGIVILMNLIVMVIEIDRGTDEGSSDDKFHWTELFGWVVLLIFVVELSLRVVVMKKKFWRDKWNVFDFAVVTSDAVISVVSLLGDSLFPVKVLRIFRLAKLARVFKVLRVFPELRLLLAGLFSSISAIFWGTVLLFLSMLLWAMMAVVLIHPLTKEIEYSDDCDRCSRAYKSVMSATLTFWQSIVTGDSWGRTTVPLIEAYPTTAVFFIAVYLSVGMAVTNLILGVVVNVAHQTVALLSEEDNATMALHKLGRNTHLLKLCRQLDTDNTGELSREEIYAAFQNPGEFRDTMESLDISRDDFEIVWTILDEDRNGSVSYSELVSRLSAMKMSDSQFMLSYIKYYITMLKNGLLDTIKANHEETMDVEKRLEQEVRKLEQEEDEIMQGEQHLLEEVADIKASILIEGHALDDISHKMGRRRRHTTTGADDANGVTSVSSANTHSELDRLRSDLRGDLAVMQMELKGMMDDMSHKLSHLGMDLDLTSKRSQQDLLVVPIKAVPRSTSGGCCKPYVAESARLLESNGRQASPIRGSSARGKFQPGFRNLITGCQPDEGRRET